MPPTTRPLISSWKWMDGKTIKLCHMRTAPEKEDLEFDVLQRRRLLKPTSVPPRVQAADTSQLLGGDCEISHSWLSVRILGRLQNWSVICPLNIQCSSEKLAFFGGRICRRSILSMLVHGLIISTGPQLIRMLINSTSSHIHLQTHTHTQLPLGQIISYFLCINWQMIS